MLQTSALLHGFDHVHLDLGYFGLRGYHLHKLLAGFHSNPSIRTDVFHLQGMSPLFTSLTIRVVTAMTAGGLKE